MSSTVLLQTPPRALDTRAKPSAVSRSIATPQLAIAWRLKSSAACKSFGRGRNAQNGFAEAPVPLGGLRPLQRMRLQSPCGAGSTAVIPCTGDEYDLGWPREFDAQYEVLDELLGEGSFGIVKAARHRVTGKCFAVKMLPKSRGKNGEWNRYVAMLRREVSLWTAVQNSHDKHVVKLHEAFEDDEYVYLVQDVCEGGDLQGLLKKQNTLDEREAAQAISGVLYMLAAAHDRNICYGDVKPANFLIETAYPCRRHQVDPTAPKGNLVVKGVDFGCSQKVNGEGRLEKRTGTPLYMAPEIFFGWYGLEVDIWAAGMMLYQLLSGKLPFFGDKEDEFCKGPKMLIVQALMDNELEFSGQSWDKISVDAKDLISKMLDVDYNSRITARAALQHNWIQHHCEHPAVVFADKESIRIRTSNILDFQGNPDKPVSSSSGTEDRKGGRT